MQTGRVQYFPLQFIVRHPLVPVSLNTVLPGHIRRITGIKAVHSAGVEKMAATATYLPVIGHLALEFNSRQYAFGHLDIPFDHSPEASDGYLETEITILNNALVTGWYENKVFTELVGSDGKPTAAWSPYLVTVYLRSLSDD